MEGGVWVGGWERDGGGCNTQGTPRAYGNIAHIWEGGWRGSKDICVVCLCVEAYECRVTREESFGATAAAHVLTRQHFTAYGALCIMAVCRSGGPHLSDVGAARLVFEGVAVAIWLLLGDECLAFEQVCRDELVFSVPLEFVCEFPRLFVLYDEGV